MDTGAWMASQMDRQIEAGLALMDEIYANFTDWVEKQGYTKNGEDFITARNRFKGDIDDFLDNTSEKYGISIEILSIALNI